MKNTLLYIVIIIAGIMGSVAVFTSIPTDTWQDSRTELVEISSDTITQQDLKEMVEKWMNNPDKEDTNQRLKIMKAYYTFEESGQKLTQDREGLTLMNQIRKMVSLDIPKKELEQLRDDVRKELGLETSNIKILYVDSNLVDCVGVGPQKCMLVRENHNSDWQMFYDKIEGFDHQEGVQYQLEVRVTDVENPPADSSSLKYTLIEIIESSS